jgi:hypothetical protein
MLLLLLGELLFRLSSWLIVSRVFFIPLSNSYEVWIVLDTIQGGRGRSRLGQLTKGKIIDMTYLLQLV